MSAEHETAIHKMHERHSGPDTHVLDARLQAVLHGTLLPLYENTETQTVARSQFIQALFNAGIDNLKHRLFAVTVLHPAEAQTILEPESTVRKIQNRYYLFRTILIKKDKKTGEILVRKPREQLYRKITDQMDEYTKTKTILVLRNVRLRIKKDEIRGFLLPIPLLTFLALPVNAQQPLLNNLSTQEKNVFLARFRTGTVIPMDQIARELNIGRTTVGDNLKRITHKIETFVTTGALPAEPILPVPIDVLTFLNLPKNVQDKYLTRVAQNPSSRSSDRVRSFLARYVKPETGKPFARRSVDVAKTILPDLSARQIQNYAYQARVELRQLMAQDGISFENPAPRHRDLPKHYTEKPISFITESGIDLKRLYISNPINLETLLIPLKSRPKEILIKAIKGISVYDLATEYHTKSSNILYTIHQAIFRVDHPSKEHKPRKKI